jgi:two-component system, cell cycle sensor histidine kinase and response regulator CckA
MAQRRGNGHAALMAQSAETILLVDDDELVRGVAQRLLALLGYDVHVAESGTDALALASRLGPPDLLLTDVRMPRMTGPDLVLAFHEELPALPVLYMSGWADGQSLDGPCVQKPFTPAALAGAVRAVLDAA